MMLSLTRFFLSPIFIRWIEPCVDGLRYKLFSGQFWWHAPFLTFMTMQLRDKICLETTTSAGKPLFHNLKMPFKCDISLNHCWSLLYHHSLLSNSVLSWPVDAHSFVYPQNIFVVAINLMYFTESLSACVSLPPSWCEIICIPIKIHIVASDC